MTRSERGRAGLAVALLVVAAVVFGCEEDALRPTGGSETHFLTRCSERCEAGLECVCGVCTTACTETASCAQHGPAAECALAPSSDAARACPGETRSYCEVTCRVDRDCAALGAGYACDDGFCRRASADSSPGTLPQPSPAPASDCPTNRLAPNELLVLGDSLFELGNLASFVDELARAEGALASDERYRDAASSLTSFLAENAFSLSVQYANAALDGPARVVIMNGGATDVLQNGCEAATDDCPAIIEAVAGARRLFARMAADGVQSVVYAFYADPVDNPGLRSRIDRLRPQIEAACRESPLQCHFLDLRPVFAGHYEDYVVGVDGIVFSSSGAQAAAASIWSLMKTRCVAP